MIVNDWVEHREDGHVYKLVPINADAPIRYCLLCNADYTADHATQGQLEAVLSDGIEAAQGIIDNTGDKGAMHRLEDWATSAADDLPQIDAPEENNVEVCQSAFSHFDELCAFAKEVAAMLDCDPATIVKSI